MGERGLKVDAYWTQFFQSARRLDNRVEIWRQAGRQDAAGLHQAGLGRRVRDIARRIPIRRVPLFAGGTLMPTNAALLFPESEGQRQFTSFYLSKMFGPNTVLQAGRFNTVDRYSKTFTGGEGIDKFNNLAFVSPPPTAHLPLSRKASSSPRSRIRTVRDGRPVRVDHDGFFKNGATFLASVALPVKFLATPGHYVFTYTASSIDATSLDQTPTPSFRPSTSARDREQRLDVRLHFRPVLWWDPRLRRLWPLRDWRVGLNPEPSTSSATSASAATA